MTLPIVERLRSLTPANFTHLGYSAHEAADTIETLYRHLDNIRCGRGLSNSDCQTIEADLAKLSGGPTTPLKEDCMTDKTAELHELAKRIPASAQWSTGTGTKRSHAQILSHVRRHSFYAEAETEPEALRLAIEELETFLTREQAK